ncbi:hypothetical protein BRC85_06025 [Halobacteriales archaeon QS_1_69_70]|nr:MAG: hypothetical protein BRC85_06025 [Halobacteriales archaeon QS_1_69_70]
MRGQANLPALAVALLVVTTTAGLALTLADDTFADARRDADERRVAVAVAERLVAPESVVTARANVLNGTAADRFADLDRFPVVGDRPYRIRLGGRTLASCGDPTGGTTVRRVVLVHRRQTVTRRPPFADGRTTLPRRTPRLTLDVAADETVRTVRSNGRVVLQDPAGLDGEYTVAVPRFETTTFAVEADGELEPGDVAVTAYPAWTTKARLEVTVA